MDCVQYLTGASGTFMTYNYRAVGGQQLQGQNYAFCFRQEEGKIKGHWKVSSDLLSFEFLI